MFHLGMEWTLEHVEQPELARRPPEGGHREVVLEHDDVRRLFEVGLGFNGTFQSEFCPNWTQGGEACFTLKYYSCTKRGEAGSSLKEKLLFSSWADYLVRPPTLRNADRHYAVKGMRGRCMIHLTEHSRVRAKVKRRRIG